MYINFDIQYIVRNTFVIAYNIYKLYKSSKFNCVHVCVCIIVYLCIPERFSRIRAQIRSRSIHYPRRAPDSRLDPKRTRDPFPVGRPLMLKVRYYKLQSISWSHVLFLGHNLVEIFFHHCLRIALEDSRRESENLEDPTFSDPRRLAQRTSSSACAGRVAQLQSVTILPRFHRKRESIFDCSEKGL